MKNIINRDVNGQLHGYQQRYGHDNTIVLNHYGEWRGMRCYLIDTNTVLLPVGYCEKHDTFRAEVRFYIR